MSWPGEALCSGGATSVHCPTSHRSLAMGQAELVQMAELFRIRFRFSPFRFVQSLL